MKTEFYIFDSLRNEWLQDDERTWAASFHSAAGFPDRQLATDIAQRERPGLDGVFVFGAAI